jgi:hypothetical protein
MTKLQAEALYRLTNYMEWELYLSIMRDRLARLHEQLEWEKPENIKTVQGQITEIKEVFKLAQQAEDFLNAP